MRVKFVWLLLALVATLLSGCGHHGGTTIRVTIGDGAIAIRQNIVIVQLKNHDKAYVLPDGRLVIAKAEVPTDAVQRAALIAYHDGAKTFVNDIVAVGVEGIHFAAHAVGKMLKGAVSGKEHEAGEQIKEGGEHLEDKAKDLCKQLDDWRIAQDAVATMIAEFKPYALIRESSVKHCREEGFSASKSDEADEKDEGDDSDHEDREDHDDGGHPAAPPVDAPQPPKHSSPDAKPDKGSLI